MVPLPPRRAAFVLCRSVSWSVGVTMLAMACLPIGAEGRSPLARPPVATQPSSPDQPSRASFVVAVVGDGFADALFEGLRDGLGTDAAYSIEAVTHAPDGLSDETRFAWASAVAPLIAARRVRAVVVMLGAADLQPLRDGTVSVDLDTPRWKVLYGDRVAALVEPFRKAGIAVTWVGLPIVADDQTASGFAVLNEIVRERATKAGAHYVDSWDAFVDEGGRFETDGPDRSGRIVKLRTADGLDFTHAGALKLASFVEPDLKHERDLALAALAAQTDVVVPHEPDVENDVNAQIRRELGLSATAPTTRDIKGPVTIVTTPPVASDGRLVAADLGPAPLPNAGGMSAAQRAIVEGSPVAPKPGRIDDFAWPRR